MDNAIRQQYLQAMGIESWVMQSPVPALSTPTTRVSESSVTPPTPVAQVVTELTLSSPVAAIIPSDSWEQLHAEVTNCQKCGLCQTRTQTVFGSGSKQADWLFIGEAPGEQEDLQGLPFVGTAGVLLTEMIRAMQLNREQIYIANILKCRPPENRDPKLPEIAACQPFLQRQIALLQPKIIVAVGRIAAQHLLNTHATLAKLRGNLHQFHNIPLLVVYHPAYLLRDLRQKHKAWQDLQLAMRTYQQMQGT